ncbi:MAG TPA: YnfA family protein [Candidatus Binatia bacterium]|jgi:small multidrug resistance family-3 protein
MAASMIAQSVALFLLAGLCEIGGGWLVWQWFREGRGLLWGFLGAVILILYGIVPTFQPAHFGRVYAAYGGVFIVLSLLWGWIFDGNVPDRFDVIGAIVSLAGVCIIMYWPR